MASSKMIHFWTKAGGVTLNVWLLQQRLLDPFPELILPQELEAISRSRLADYLRVGLKYTGRAM